MIYIYMYNDIYIYIYIYSLCQRVLDVWLMKRPTGCFVIFNTNTTLIDRPIDLSVLLVHILLSFVLSFVRHSPVFCMSFVYLSITKLFDNVDNSICTTMRLVPTVFTALTTVKALTRLTAFVTALSTLRLR